MSNINLAKSLERGRFSPLLRRVLGELSNEPGNVHLAGGTALALYLDHRISTDIDLFADTDMPRMMKTAEAAVARSEAVISHRGMMRSLDETTGWRLFVVSGATELKVDCAMDRVGLRYSTERLGRLPVSSLKDIYRRKLQIALGKWRSEARDLLDIFTMDRKVMPIEKAIAGMDLDDAISDAHVWKDWLKSIPSSTLKREIEETMFSIKVAPESIIARVNAAFSAALAASYDRAKKENKR